MRRFHSYGPVDCEDHFCVKRHDLIEQCITQLLGPSHDQHAHKQGYYFTVWAPRQSGKTWLIRQVKQEISQRYGDQFVVFSFSLGTLRDMQFTPAEQTDFPARFGDILEIALPGKPIVQSWKEFYRLFSRDGGLWQKPLILLIDEVDTIPSALIDIIVAQFRELFLERETNWLHGLALVGVRAVVGVDSQRGSPFNVQRSLPVPNLTPAEVQELYRQYQTESGQKIEPAVVKAIYDSTRGQPGLVSWFGELLTEKYNPGQAQTIDLKTWDYVYENALHTEFNNTVLNLIKKARTTYQRYVIELFSRSDIRFSLDTDWCNYMYMHGLIDQEKIPSERGIPISVCRFSSPFIQYRVYNALTYDLFDEFSAILTLDPLDDLHDVFAGQTLNLPALLDRYKDYLARLKAKGINPWREQPRRKTDLHLTEAVGHFHLFSWLRETLTRRCIVSPEFPTGNGKVDLHVSCATKQGVIEVKSFKDSYQLKEDRNQAAQYAKNLRLRQVTLAVFVPIEDNTVLDKLSEVVVIEGVQVTVVAIGWV